MRSNVFAKFATFISLTLASVSAWADAKVNMTKGVSTYSGDIYYLHMTIFWITVVIGILVFGAMAYIIYKHRKSKGAVASKVHENLKIEVIWTIVPFVILIAMAVPATTVLMKMNDTSYAKVNVKITGYQWKWRYEYLDNGISFFSNLSTPVEQINNEAKKNKWYLLEVDKPLVLPINEKIRFLVTSNDVIHSWWVPALGVKRDAVPGYIYEAWTVIKKPGIYRGQCAELCGVNHGYMPIVVKAVTQKQYAKWVEAQKVKKEKQAVESQKTMTIKELMTQGKAGYDKYCLACHQADGKGLPPAFPALKGSSVTVGPIERHIRIVLDGVPGSAMQAFGPQLSDAEVAAIVTYERNSWGNNANDMAQPAQVKAVREKANKKQ